MEKETAGHKYLRRQVISEVYSTASAAIDNFEVQSFSRSWAMVSAIERLWSWRNLFQKGCTIVLGFFAGIFLFLVLGGSVVVGGPGAAKTIAGWPWGCENQR